MLDNGNHLPPIDGKDLDGADVTISDLIDGAWSAVLFYRGHW